VFENDGTFVLLSFGRKGRVALVHRRLIPLKIGGNGAAASLFSKILAQQSGRAQNVIGLASPVTELSGFNRDP
jgi:hypothetical protein